jgi:hypothetical protein
MGVAATLGLRFGGWLHGAQGTPGGDAGVQAARVRRRGERCGAAAGQLRRRVALTHGPISMPGLPSRRGFALHPCDRHAKLCRVRRYAELSAGGAARLQPVRVQRLRHERTPWVPAAEFNEHIGLGGVNLESGYGSVYVYNDMDWRDTWIEGAHEVSPLDAFTDRRAAYPVLQWCRGRDCAPATE